MGAILGHVSLNNKPVDENLFRSRFRKIRPFGAVNSSLIIKNVAGYGCHDLGLGGAALKPLQEGPFYIVADAFLYARKDLAKALRLSPSAHSDTSLILKAFYRWGERCLNHLCGDFAFAIHNIDEKTIFLARDHIGSRPLYWSERNGLILFSSYIDGIVGFEDLSWSINEERVSRWLGNPNEIRPETFFDGIKAVESGHWVRLRPRRVEVSRWWDPESLTKQWGISPKDAVEEVLHLTRRAVRVRLPSKRPKKPLILYWSRASVLV